MKDTTLVVAGMATLAAGTYAFRLSGQLLRARISFPPRAGKLLEAAAVILLAALVATTALTEGHGFSGFARPAGVLVGGVLAWRKAPFLVIVIAAAATAALLRLAGLLPRRPAVPLAPCAAPCAPAPLPCRPGAAPDVAPVSSGPQVAFHGFDFGGERAGHARPDVRLEHQADPRRFGRDGIHGPLDHRHGLVPVAFDGGEHGVGPVRQPAVPNHPDGLGHHLANGFPGTKRRHGKRDKHGSLLR